MQYNWERLSVSGSFGCENGLGNIYINGGNPALDYLLPNFFPPETITILDKLNERFQKMSLSEQDRVGISVIDKQRIISYNNVIRLAGAYRINNLSLAAGVVFDLSNYKLTVPRQFSGVVRRLDSGEAWAISDYLKNIGELYNLLGDNDNTKIISDEYEQLGENIERIESSKIDFDAIKTDYYGSLISPTIGICYSDNLVRLALNYEMGRFCFDDYNKLYRVSTDKLTMGIDFLWPKNFTFSLGGGLYFPDDNTLVNRLDKSLETDMKSFVLWNASLGIDYSFKDVAHAFCGFSVYNDSNDLFYGLTLQSYARSSPSNFYGLHRTYSLGLSTKISNHIILIFSAKYLLQNSLFRINNSLHGSISLNGDSSDLSGYKINLNYTNRNNFITAVGLTYNF